MLAGGELILVDVDLWHAVDADGTGELWLCLTVIVGSGIGLQLRSLGIFHLVITEISYQELHRLLGGEGERGRHATLLAAVHHISIHTCQLRSKIGYYTIQIVEELGTLGNFHHLEISLAIDILHQECSLLHTCILQRLDILCLHLVSTRSLSLKHGDVLLQIRQFLLIFR